MHYELPLMLAVLGFVVFLAWLPIDTPQHYVILDYCVATTDTTPDFQACMTRMRALTK